MPASSIFLSTFSVRALRSSASGWSSTLPSSSDLTASSASASTTRIWSSSLALLLSTRFLQTNVYLLAADSIFVPSMYWTSRLTRPSSLSIVTTWVKIPSNTPFSRLLLNMFIVLKSGRFFPESHMYTTFSASSVSILRPEKTLSR